MRIWKRNRTSALVAAALGTMGLSVGAQSADQAADEFVNALGSPVRSGATGSCVRTGFWVPGMPSAECVGPAQKVQKPPEPVAQPTPKPAPPPPTAAAPAPTPPPAEPPVAEFVHEPEPPDMVPVPPMTAAVEDDDRMSEPTQFYDEDDFADRGEDILGRDVNPNFYDQVAAADTEMARAQIPAPTPPAPTPSPPAQVAKLTPPPAEDPLHLTLDSETYFAFNKYVLKPSGQEKVDQLLAALAATQYDVIVITGHTDRIGTKEYNKKLSEQRALQVKQYLVKNGVDPKKIQAKWIGAAEPVTPPGACEGLAWTKTVQCLAPDRRVEVQVIGARPR